MYRAYLPLTFITSPIKNRIDIFFCHHSLSGKRGGLELLIIKYDKLLNVPHK